MEELKPKENGEAETELDSSFEESKLNFNIPNPDEDGLIEDYLRDDYSMNSRMIGMSFPPSNDFISELKESPEQFLNFGMNYSDFKVYLLKHLHMRVERALLHKAIETFKERRK